ncbi:MAG: hypothetical protein GX790_02315 [Syntrophomonadaceae bacterium]|nr:hypothetical protein [Syntrophomonadaceae bacterium]
MLGDISKNEVELLNVYALLGPTGQKDLKDYIRYLLTKQYRKDVMTAVFNNKLIQNLLHSLLHIIEKDDFDIYQAKKRILQIKELYYGVFEKVHLRYAELIEDLDSNEIVREFGRISFENLNMAFDSNDRGKIQFEIINFYQEYMRLSKKKDARQIVAV